MHPHLREPQQIHRHPKHDGKRWSWWASLYDRIWNCRMPRLILVMFRWDKWRELQWSRRLSEVEIFLYAFFCCHFYPFLFWWLDDVVWFCPLLASLRLRNVKPVVVSSGPQMREKWSQGCWPPWNCYRTSKLVVGRWISFWDGLVSGAM